jgi:Amt family ammonium transporter
VGSILTGVFAAKAMGGFAGLIEGNTDQFLSNLYGTVISMAFGFFMTYFLLSFLKVFMNVNVQAKEEEEGLDRALHGEEAYDF